MCNYYALIFQDDYIPYPRIEEVRLNYTMLLLCPYTSAHSSHCELQVLERGGPYPMVILPEFGGYWIEDPEAPPPTPPPTSMENKEALRREDEQLPRDYGYQLEEISEAARAYRRHFLGRVRLKLKFNRFQVRILSSLFNASFLPVFQPQKID